MVGLAADNARAYRRQQTAMLSKMADYYFGGEDDGAMTTGWLLSGCYI